MAKSRTSFAKLERERAKQAKARQKSERRAARGTEDDAAPDGPGLDPATLIARLQQLQEALEAGEIDAVEFEERRDELAQLLTL